METIDQIHQKLTTLNLATFESNEVNRLIGRAFRAGKAGQADPLAGYSNLTEAIKAGEPIDWERLDGLKVQCVKPEVGTLRGALKRDNFRKANSASAWWDEDIGMVYARALERAWIGSAGWSLWLEGEVPLRRKTADQLGVGTYFLGQTKGDSPYLAYVGRPLTNVSEKTIYYAPEMLKAITPATDWEVLEEYGTFQKPEGK